MAGKNRFGTLMAMAAGAATTAAVITYDRQKRESVARLQSDSQIAQTKAGQVEYAIVGEGPAVLSVHGMLGGYDQGLVISKPLANAGFKVIAVSRFGYLQTPPASTMTPEVQADQFAALLDKLNIADVVVLGASGGGPSSLQFALRYPDRCRALVMMCAVSHSLSTDRRGNTPTLRLLTGAVRSDFLMWLAITGIIKGQPLLNSLNPEAQQNPPDDPKRRELFKEMLYSLFPVSLRQFGLDNDLVQIQTLADLPLEQITAPTLVLHGTADGLVPFTQAEHTVSRIPGARLVTAEGGDHDFFVSHYDQVWPEIIAFLKKKPQASAAKATPAKKTPVKKTPAKKTPVKKTPARKKAS
jgi:2-hydroxy-6-oxonona-2,4-dienedioate hydrolase